LYAFLVALAVVALLGLTLATSALALLGLVFAAAAVPATRTVLAGTTGKGLIAVLQRTGLAELLYAAGVLVGLTLATPLS
ncbi:MAG: 1,4-dihydroxy-2-naphthoate polyprenyltransferase, partial [Nocardioidaceae bacterium]